MTHIFVIFNNLNKRLCEAYIADQSIDPRSVVFLNFRAGTYKTDTFREVELYENELKLVSFRSTIHFLISSVYAHFLGLRSVDRLIDRIVNKAEFVAYLPHTYSPILHSICSHALCAQVFMMEEGDASYFTDRFYDPFGFRNFLGSNARRLLLECSGLAPRIGRAEFFPEELRISGAICISGDAFPFYRNKKVLDATQIFPPDEQLWSSYRYGCSLFLIDPISRFGWISESGYLDALCSFINEHKAWIEKLDVLVSFHPSLRKDQDFCVKVFDIFEKSGVYCRSYSGDIEVLLNSVDHSQVFGLFSSSLRYAKVLNAGAYNWLEFSRPFITSQRYQFLKDYHSSVGSIFLKPMEEPGPAAQS